MSLIGELGDDEFEDYPLRRWLGRLWISNAAPSILKETLSSGDDLARGELAQRTVELQLISYQDSLDAAKLRTATQRAPSLIDSTARKIAQKDSEELLHDLGKIPEAILQSRLWSWTDMPYAFGRAVFDHLAAAGIATLDEKQMRGLDDWILLNEKHLRETDGMVGWEAGLVTLSQGSLVFPTSTASKTMRKIPRMDVKSLDGLLLIGHSRAPLVTIQASDDQFAKVFATMSNGLLKGLDWSNVFVASGIVVGTLMSAARDKTIAENWESSDIDLYIYGLTVAEANEKIKHIFKVFSSNLPRGTDALLVRNVQTITFFAKYPLRRVQIVLKLVKSPRSVLVNFDLDICSMGWDGKRVWMLPRAARALETGFSTFTMDLIEGHYLGQRRASHPCLQIRPQRVRHLPSYLAIISLAGESSAERDLEALASLARRWTIVLPGNRPGISLSLEKLQPPARTAAQSSLPVVSHDHLADNYAGDPLNPTQRGAMYGFVHFMKHTVLYDFSQEGQIAVPYDAKGSWATSESSPHNCMDYDDTSSYPWDENYSVQDHVDSLESFNAETVEGWLRVWLDGSDDELDDSTGLGISSEFFASDAWPHAPPRRISWAKTVEDILGPLGDTSLLLLLPITFAQFANALLMEAGGVETAPLVSVPCEEPDHAQGEEYGIYVWRADSTMMWQQRDRRIDEVVEVLNAFYTTYRTGADRDDYWLSGVLVRELSMSAIRTCPEDEMKAFRTRVWVDHPAIVELVASMEARLRDLADY